MGSGWCLMLSEVLHRRSQVWHQRERLAKAARATLSASLLLSEQAHRWGILERVQDIPASACIQADSDILVVEQLRQWS